MKKMQAQFFFVIGGRNQNPKIRELELKSKNQLL